MSELVCIGCGVVREFNHKKRESLENYQRRRPYCIPCGHRNRIATLGKHGPGWKGGRFKTRKGYIRIYVEGGYVFEHRYIFEKMCGEIPRNHVIHHIDGDKENNQIENLMCLSKKDHDTLHGDHLRANHYNNGTKRTENLLCAA